MRTSSITRMPYCSRAARSLLAVSYPAWKPLCSLVLSRRNQGIQILRCQSAAERPDQMMSCRRISAEGISPTLCTKRSGIFNAPGDVVFDDQVLLVAGQELRRRGL